MKVVTLHFAMILAAVTAFAATPAPTRTVFDATLKNGFTIHHLRHQNIGASTRLFTDDSNYVDVPTSEIAEITSSVEVLPVPPESVKPKPTIQEVVAAASDKHLVDADLITSVIHAESAFNPKAVSPKGAQGLMQLMPGTASILGVADAFDPQANVDAGTKYLRDLLVRYNGDIAMALAAYNAGPLRVQQYHGVPPYSETRAYVAQIIKEFNRKKIEQRAAAKRHEEKPAADDAPVKGK